MLFRPQLRVGDGPRAFLRKVADQNGLTLPFLSRAGVTFNGASLRAMGFASALGDKVELDVYVDAISESLRRFPDAWLYGRSRFCPECLRASSQWRVNWEVRFADACTQHGTWLLDRCDCGRAMDWNRPSLLHCRCGCLLTSLHGVECPPAIRALTQSVVLVATGQANPGATTPIRELDLGALVRVVLLLGYHSSSRTQESSRKRMRTSSMEDSWNISSTAAAICEGWPQSFARVLDGHSAAARGTSGEGRLPGTFGTLYRLLYRGRPPEFEAIRALFEQYLAANWRGALGRRNTWLAHDISKRASWQPIGRIAKQLGVAPRIALKRLERSGAAVARRTSLGGRAFLVAKQGDAAIEAVGARTHLTLVEAAKALGLPKGRVRDLARAQVLPAGRRGFSSPWSVDCNDLAKILEVVEHLPVVQDCPRNAVSLAHVLRYWACSNTLARDLVRALIDGELPVLSRLSKHSGLGGLLLNVAHVRRLRDKFVQQRLDERMTVPEVTRQLGIKQEVTYHFIRHGFLEASMERLGASRRRSVVTPAAIQAFRARYAFARDLARLFECSPKTLVAGLQMLGAVPAAGPAFDGCRQVMYRRDETLLLALKTYRAVRQVRGAKGRLAEFESQSATASGT